MGDRTQIASALLAAETGRPWSVFLGLMAALTLLNALTVGLGQTMLKRLDLGLLQMEFDGRPDGKRIAGSASWLEFYERQQQKRARSGPMPTPSARNTAVHVPTPQPTAMRSCSIVPIPGNRSAETFARFSAGTSQARSSTASARAGQRRRASAGSQ